MYGLVSNDQVAESWSELLVQPLKGMGPETRLGEEARSRRPFVPGISGHNSITIRTAVRASPGGRRGSGLQSIRESRRSGRAEKTRSGHNSGRSQKLRIRPCLANSWCERGDSNPHGFPRQILSLVRLPIPPLSQLFFSIIYGLVLCDLKAWIACDKAISGK